jgi:hypothetical protein
MNALGSRILADIFTLLVKEISGPGMDDRLRHGWRSQAQMDVFTAQLSCLVQMA